MICVPDDIMTSSEKSTFIKELKEIEFGFIYCEKGNRYTDSTLKEELFSIFSDQFEFLNSR